MAEMWRTKSCIIEMFLAFYETHHRPESSYRDFLQEVLSVYEEWKNARVPLDYFKRFEETATADIGGWYNVMPNIGDNYAEEEMQSVMKTEPVDDAPHPADKENETNPFLYGLPDSESCSSSSSSVAESDSTSGLQDDPSYVSRVDPTPVNLLSRRRWKRTDVMSCSEGSHKCPTCHRRFRSLNLLERHKVRHLAAAAVVEGSLGLRCSECQIVLPTRSCFIRHSLQHHSMFGSEKKDEKEEAEQAGGVSIGDADAPEKGEKDCPVNEATAVDNGNKMEMDDVDEKVKVETEDDEDDEEGEDKNHSKEIPSQSEVVFPGLLKPETTPMSSSALKMEVAPTPVLTAQSDLPSSSSVDIHSTEVPSNVLTNSLQHNLPPVLASAYQMPSGPSRRCPVCGKGISNKNNWERHLLIHTGVKPFKCRFCGKAFNRKDNLATHEKKHTKHMEQQMQLQQLHQHHVLQQQQSQPQETQQQQQSQSSPNFHRHQEQPQQPQSVSPKKSSERDEAKEKEQQQEEEHQKQHQHHHHQQQQQTEDNEKQHHPHLHQEQQQQQSISSFYHSPQQGTQDSQQQRHQHPTSFHPHQQQIASSTFQHHHYHQQPAVQNFIQHQETHKSQSMTPHHPQHKEVPQHQHTHSHPPRHIQQPLPPPPTHTLPQHVHPQHQHSHHHHHHHHHPAHQNQHPHTHAQQHQICGRL